MKRIFLLALLFWVPFTLMAQAIDVAENAIFAGNGLIPNTSDIRGSGMGKTGVAGTKNSNALFTNPSLLGAMDKITMFGAARCRFGLINDEKMDDSVNKINDIPNMSFQYESINLPPYVSLEGLGFGIPFRIETSKIPVTIGLALGYRPTYNYGSSNTVEYKVQNDTSVVQEKGKIVSKSRGGHRTLSAGLGIGINDVFYFGSSINFCIVPTQSMKVESEIETNAGESNATETSEYKGRGFYATFGLAARPVPTLTIGMRVSPFIDFTFSDYTYEMIVDNETIVEMEDVTEYDIKYPALFAAGISWQIIPRLTIATEFQTRAYSYIEIESEEVKIDNGFCARIGSEVLAGIVPVRVGFSIESITNPDEKVVTTTGTPTIVSDDKPNLVFGPTLGASVPIGENIVIDFAGGYEFFRKERKGFSVLDTGIINYNSDAHNIQVDLGLTVNFDGLVFGGTGKPETPKAAPRRRPKPTAQETPEPAPELPPEPVQKVEPPVQEEPEVSPEPETLPPEPESKVGTHVIITTNDGKTVVGTLVRETDTIYELDSYGEKITIFKGIVVSVE